MMNSNETYSTFLAQNYDSFYKKKHLHTETASAIFNYAKAFFDNDNLSFLDVGCGTGNHALEIAKKGASVTGLDISIDMIKEAQKKCHLSNNPTFLLGSPKILKGKYDVAYSITNVINCLNNKNDLYNFFKETKQALKKGSLFIFDTWNTPVIKTFPPLEVNDEAITNSCVFSRKVIPGTIQNDNSLKIDYIYTNESKQNKVTHRIQLFETEEIEATLNDSGFKILHIFNNIREQERANNQSREILYITKRL